MGERVASKFGKQPPTSDYGDNEIFGSRARTNQLIDRLRAGNDSECVIVAIGTFAAKEQWKLRDLIGVDKRLIDMLRGLEIEHALPIQRYSWPKIHRAAFANLIISPEATGKTHAHLLYAVSRCIQSTPLQATNELLDGVDRHQFEPNETTNLEQLIIHPKFIIICSSQDHAESINRTIDQMKEKAYGIDAADSRRRLMPPVSGAINIQQDDTKLALRCNESDILIGTPPTILKCLRQGLIHFAKCQKVFFDDLDVSLQLQNSNIREVIKIYLRQDNDSQSSSPTSNRACRVHLFSRKWTDLVRQFMSSVFIQRTLLFGSLAEASVYNNVRFEVETYQDIKDKCSILSSLITRLLDNSNREKIGIVSRTDEEARTIGQILCELGHNIKMLREDSTDGNTRGLARSRTLQDLVFVISDSALEFEVEVSNRRRPLDDIVHIVHASLPEDMLIFDQRFRLSFRHIQDKKSGLSSTVFIGPDFNAKLAKQLYDLMSRSSTTQTATRLTMRDFISSQASHLCWRWATTGLCRLEKLSRDDRFGSYCSDRHSFERGAKQTDNRWPEAGLVKITITHIVSPSEFYFWFESYYNSDDGKSIRLNKSGCDHMWELQQDLDKLKSAGLRSVPLSKIRKGCIYGVYFPQEARLDRVRLLDEPKHATGTTKVNVELEYSKLIPIFKIDYGARVEVYVKNLIELPERLSKHPAQAHRAFHLGYKPTDNEPNWLYKTKKRFYDLLTANGTSDVTAWLRLNREGCFWFDNLIVARRLTNIDSAQVCSSQPHRQLQQEGLADLAVCQPAFIMASSRLETICKWNSARLNGVAQYAFLKRDIEMVEIYVLSVMQDFKIYAMQTCFKKQLDSLERRILQNFEDGKLIQLSHFAPGVFCLARILIGNTSTLNRAKIISINQQDNDIESHQTADEEKVLVLCLDYGDQYELAKADLYRAELDHIKLLPFQACLCQLANVNDNLKTDPEQNLTALNKITDLTRDQDDSYVPVKAQRDKNGHLYLYVMGEEPTVYESLSSLLRQSSLTLHAEPNPEMERPVKVDTIEQPSFQSDAPFKMVDQQICNLLRQIVERELIQ